jgi:cytochrome c oxidase cbb3-type subunit 1
MQQTINYDNQIVRWYVISAIIWGLVAMLVGIYIAFEMVFPALNFDQPWLSFGRLRPVHTNGIIFGFTLSAVFATVFYAVPRLLKVEMWSRKLSRIQFWLYNLTIVLAAITLMAGYTQSKEYAELEWPLDILVVVWWVIFAANVFMTIKNRKQKQIYVAIWFFMATIITIAVLYLVNNLSIPAGLLKSYSVYSGTTDANIQWWYGHNAVAFVLTTPILGMMYYFLPKHTNLPIYSHRLSILHFWSLIFIYIWAGPHHLLYTPIPDWAQTLGMVFSIMLIAPSWGGMINGFLTLSQAKEKIRTDATLKFMLVALTFYGMSTLEGPIMSIRAVNSLSHNTDWTIGHVHGGALGWVAGMCVAGMYYLVPRLWNTKLYSEKLANIHFWVSTVGILLYYVSMWVSGIVEGLMWKAYDGAGRLVYDDWSSITDDLFWFRLIRGVGGVLFITGFVIMIYNVYKTTKTKGSGFVPADLRVKETSGETQEVGGKLSEA